MMFSAIEWIELALAEGKEPRAIIRASGARALFYNAPPMNLSDDEVRLVLDELELRPGLVDDRRNPQ